MILWINGCDDVSRRRVDDVGASWGWWEEKDSGSAGHGGECNGQGRRDERAKGRRKMWFGERDRCETLHLGHILMAFLYSIFDFLGSSK